MLPIVKFLPLLALASAYIKFDMHELSKREVEDVDTTYTKKMLYVQAEIGTPAQKVIWSLIWPLRKLG